MFGELASCFLVLCIGINLLILIKQRANLEAVKAYDSFYIPLSFSLAAILSVWPLFQLGGDGNPAYGDAMIWCFVREKAEGILWILHGPMIFTCLFGIAVLFLVKLAEYNRKRFNKRLRQYHTYDFRDVKLKFLPSVIALYLTSFVLSWFPVILLFVHDQFNPGGYEYWLMLMLVVCIPLHGLWNALVAYYQYFKGRRAEFTEEEYSFP